jgi:hypothetical protein
MRSLGAGASRPRAPTDATRHGTRRGDAEGPGVGEGSSLRGERGGVSMQCHGGFLLLDALTSAPSGIPLRLSSIRHWHLACFHTRLPRLHWACPSAALDERVARRQHSFGFDSGYSGRAGPPDRHSRGSHDRNDPLPIEKQGRSNLFPATSSAGRCKRIGSGLAPPHSGHPLGGGRCSTRESTIMWADESRGRHERAR